MFSLSSKTFINCSLLYGPIERLRASELSVFSPLFLTNRVFAVRAGRGVSLDSSPLIESKSDFLDPLTLGTSESKFSTHSSWKYGRLPGLIMKPVFASPELVIPPPGCS
jgi:hypothetical protein